MLRAILFLLTAVLGIAKQLPIHVYTTADGLAGRESSGSFEIRTAIFGSVPRAAAGEIGISPANWMAFAEDPSGNLWVGTRSGQLLRHRDGRFRAFGNDDGMLVTALSVRGVPQPVSELGNPSVSLTDLPSQQNQIQIDFTSLNFQPGRLVSYQYRLLGSDAAWSSPAPLRTVNCASLKPSRYRFEVRADDSIAPPATVDFTLLPPVWARWWFLTGCGSLLGAAALGAHRYRMRQALALERVRARIAADLHDDIGASLSQIAMLSEVARFSPQREPNSPSRRWSISSEGPRTRSPSNIGDSRRHCLPRRSRRRSSFCMESRIR